MTQATIAGSSPSFLRRALQLDAVATAATALLAIAAAGPLADWLGLPAGLLRGAGIVLVPFVALVAWASLRPHTPIGAVRLIVAANIAWAVASVVLVVSGWVAPTTLGVVFVLAQALIVAGFAELQILGLRRVAAAE